MNAGLRKNGHARDSQRARVYAAERALKDDKFVGKFCYWDEPALTCKQVQQRVDEILAGPARVRYQYDDAFLPSCYDRKLPIMDIALTIRHSRSKQFAFYRWGGRQRLNEITLPEWSRRGWVWALHELAHAIITPHVRGAQWSAHGPQWAECYIWLVTNYISRELGATLRMYFIRYKVSIAEGAP
jgi:putative metallohydrolase (TIGR04338 family)